MANEIRPSEFAIRCLPKLGPALLQRLGGRCPVFPDDHSSQAWLPGPWERHFLGFKTGKSRGEDPHLKKGRERISNSKFSKANVLSKREPGAWSQEETCLYSNSSCTARPFPQTQDVRSFRTGLTFLNPWGPDWYLTHRGDSFSAYWLVNKWVNASFFYCLKKTFWYGKFSRTGNLFTFKYW